MASIGGEEATARRVTCLVTIHGIGFQQPPVGDIPGYADKLHANLKARLGDLLSDDPGRKRSQPGEAGAIYVQSEYPTGTGDRQEGMRRLGVWDQTRRFIDTTNAPLVDPAYANRDAVAHVALVYANLEDVDAGHVGSAVDAGVRSLLASWRYLSVTASPGWLGGVVRGLSRGSAKAPTGPSLRVRTDVQGLRGEVAEGKSVTPKETPPGGGLLSTLGHLENDVCAYVCRNDLRTRVRGFVAEALIRLCTRKDVKWVIVNAHSQGTVAAYDVLRGMPPATAARIPAVYTHGSPLRKYLDLFAWGDDVGILNGSQWINVWDPTDPVADPLRPGRKWRVGMDPNPAVPPTLFQYRDPDGGPPVPVRNMEDRPVDNLTNSGGGGLQAHNYWDNVEQVVKPLADHLAQVAVVPVPQTAI